MVVERPFASTSPSASATTVFVLVIPTTAALRENGWMSVGEVDRWVGGWVGVMWVVTGMLNVWDFNENVVCASLLTIVATSRYWRVGAIVLRMKASLNVPRYIKPELHTGLLFFLRNEGGWSMGEKKYTTK